MNKILYYNYIFSMVYLHEIYQEIVSEDVKESLTKRKLVLNLNTY